MKRTRQNKAFTLAEMLITLAVMGLVLALVATFIASSSKATSRRTKEAGRLREIESLNTLVKDWFYNFDSTEYKVNAALSTNGSEEPEYIFDYENDVAVEVNESYITIQNRKFSTASYKGGIVPFNYQLIYSVDRLTFEPAVSAIYSADDIRTVALNYITNIDFIWDESLGMLKCVYSYQDIDNEKLTRNYTMLLSKHTNK